MRASALHLIPSVTQSILARARRAAKEREKGTSNALSAADPTLPGIARTGKARARAMAKAKEASQREKIRARPSPRPRSRRAVASTMATHSPGFGARPMAGRGSGTDGNPIYNVNPMFAKLTGTLAVSSC